MLCDRSFLSEKEIICTKKTLKNYLFPPRLELRTFRVLGERDNHYTTGTVDVVHLINNIIPYKNAK